MSRTEKLRKFVLETYLFSDDDSLLGNDESFLEKGIIDSTGVVELVLFLEEEFGITVSDEDMTPENLDSVSRVAAFLERKAACV